MSMADLTAAVTAMNALRDRYNTLPAEVDAKTAALDAKFNALRGKLMSPTVLRYNEATIHSKTSLNLGADPADPTRSVWGEIIPPSQSFFQLNQTTAWLAALTLASCTSIPAGYAENPKYANDKSRTFMQFVVAPVGASNAQINQLLIDQAKTPLLSGVWGNYAVGAALPVLAAPAISTWARLFVRFINYAAVDASIPAGTPAQNISFGGNASFAVLNVNLFAE